MDIIALLWTLFAIFFVGMITNWFGLMDKKTYKGTWVKVRYDSMPKVMENLRSANAFMNHDGMHMHLEMSVAYIDSIERKPVYEIKIPQHVFHNVEHDIILKEIGIK